MRTHGRQLYGNDANGEETGYHLLLNDGEARPSIEATTWPIRLPTVSTIWGSRSQDDRVVDGDGNPSATLQQLADWLTQLSTDKSTTNTPLDRMADMVMADSGLSQNISDQRHRHRRRLRQRHVRHY